MKKNIRFFCLFAVVLLAFSFLSCNKSESGDSITVDKDTSYAIGMYIGENFSLPVPVHYDYKAFMEGFRDYTEKQETRLTQDQVYEKLEELFAKVTTQMEGTGKSEGEEFLAENARKPGIITTASGLQYEIIVRGDGPKPTASDVVEVHYEGTLIDGTVFDSSYARGEPAIFPLNGVIQGWTEGIQLMNTGSTFRFFIPSDLGYGSRGAGGAIPPNAVLIFKVELLGVLE